MKQFVSLVVAALLGSIVTLVANQYVINGDQAKVKIEHVNGVPTAQVAYRVNEKGETVALDFTGTAEKVTAAVVHIKSSSKERVISRERDIDDPFRFFFGPQSPMQQGPSQSTGSGVIINADGYIVTNNHVVRDADVVEVTLSDNRTFKAEVIGTDPDTDLAVIKISQKNLPYLSFVDSDKARVGEWVLAIGNPFNLNSTVTAGIISAKGRNINIINSNNRQGKAGEEPARTAIESFIQTDAAINPGNSGGALVNLDGGLLGINTAIASPTGAYSGYGFAVPSDIVSKVVEDLLAYGTVQRGWLGVEVRNVDSDLVKQEDLAVNEGAYINSFGDAGDKSAAKAAGVKPGDVVVKIDDAPIKSSTALIEYVGRKRPGDKLNLTIDRKGKELAIQVTLKNRAGNVATVKREEKDAIASLGMELEEVEDKTLKKLDLENGVRVKSLQNGKVSRSTDMREGFIITRIDNKKISSVKDADAILKTKKPGDLITFDGVYPNYPREYVFALRY
jgi:Do/DeqQ family serine protease